VFIQRCNFIFLFLLLAVKSTSAFALKTSEIKYKADGKTMIGFLVLPDEYDEKTPAVMVVHEWWGQNDYPRKRAKMLAELGYVAFAVDMYGDRTIVDHPKDARSFAGKAMADGKTVRVRFDAALKALRKKTAIKESRIAAIGYCFGGSVVLEMARQGKNLAGVVSFHGGLMTPSKAKKGNVKTKILVLNGGADKMVSAEHIIKFKKEMDKAGAKYEFVSYPGALHAYTNQSATAVGKKYGIPLAYNQEADKKSWQRMSEFLHEIF